MTATQRLANMLNTLFFLAAYAKFQPPSSVSYRVDMLDGLDQDIRWMHQQGQAQRAVSMCLIFAARQGLNSSYTDIRNIYWQQWTQKYQPEMRNPELFEDYQNRVGNIMSSMMQQAVTEHRALQFALVS